LNADSVDAATTPALATRSTAARSPSAPERSHADGVRQSANAPTANAAMVTAHQRALLGGGTHARSPRSSTVVSPSSIGTTQGSKIMCVAPRSARTAGGGMLLIQCVR
jgi:hypothetical protein